MVDQEQIEKDIKRYASDLDIPEYMVDEQYWDMVDREKLYILIQEEIEKKVDDLKGRMLSLVEQYEKSDAVEYGGVTVSEALENHFMNT